MLVSVLSLKLLSTCHVSRLIRRATGDDGLYHWKLFLAEPGSVTAGTWHDVVWSDDKGVGMEHRGPKQYSEAKSKGLIGVWEIGLVDKDKADLVDETCANTKTPKYDIEDKDKNCQTWIYDVVGGLVKQRVLGSDANDKLNLVPKKGDD